MPSEKVTSREILDAVRKRWPAESHIIIEEAPEDRSRQGRKIDALVLGFWQTHGYEVEAVEVKVSTTDLRKEIKDPRKSDFWWRHSNRFWIATTADVFRLCKDEIPDTWGVLVINKSGSLVKKVQAPKTPREELSHLTWLGMARALRADHDQIKRIAHGEGYAEGKAVSRSGHRETAIQRSYNELREKVDVFEKSSGLSIARGWELEKVGEIVKLLRGRGPREVAQEQLAQIDRHRNALLGFLEDS